MSDDARTNSRITFKEDHDANHYFMVDENNHWWMKLLVNGEQITERQEANMRRLAASWNWCLDIPIDKLETKSIDEYVSEQAFLTGMAPAGDAFGFGLNGLACQMLAASFAGQFVGSGAVNFLEVNMSHPEIGPFTVTILRHQGKTPGQMKAEVEQQLEAERASLFAESQRKQQLEQQCAQLLAALEAAKAPLEMYRAYGWTDRNGVIGKVDAAIAEVKGSA